MSKELTDGELLNLWVKHRSSKDLGLLFSRYSNSVYHLCLSVLKNGADAEDATQKTFIKVMRFAENKRDEGDLKSWILKTAINTCKDEIKHMVTHKKHSISASEMKTRSVSEAEPVDKELSDVVMSSLELMEMKFRMPIWLKHYEDLSVKEIAEVLGRPEKTIRTQISRGIDRLREIVLKVKPAASLSAILAVLSYQKAHAAVPVALTPKLISMTNESARMLVASAGKSTSLALAIKVGVVTLISSGIFIVAQKLDLFKNQTELMQLQPTVKDESSKTYYEWRFQEGKVPSDWTMIESEVSFEEKSGKNMMSFKDDLFTAYLNVPADFIDYEMSFKVKPTKNPMQFWVSKAGEGLKVHYTFNSYSHQPGEVQEFTMRRVGGLETVWRSGRLLMAYVSDAKDSMPILLKLKGPFLLEYVKVKKLNAKDYENFDLLKEMAVEHAASKEKNVHFTVKNPYSQYGTEKLDGVVY